MPDNVICRGNFTRFKSLTGFTKDMAVPTKKAGNLIEDNAFHLPLSHAVIPLFH